MRLDFRSFWAAASLDLRRSVAPDGRKDSSSSSSELSEGVGDRGTSIVCLVA